MGLRRASGRCRAFVRRWCWRLVALATMGAQTLECAYTTVQARDQEVVVESGLAGHVLPLSGTATDAAQAKRGALGDDGLGAGLTMMIGARGVECRQ